MNTVCERKNIKVWCSIFLKWDYNDLFTSNKAFYIPTKPFQEKLVLFFAAWWKNDTDHSIQTHHYENEYSSKQTIQNWRLYKDTKEKYENNVLLNRTIPFHNRIKPFQEKHL